MTVERLKNMLFRVQNLDDAINEKLIKLSELKSCAVSGGAIRYDKDRVQSSVNGSTLEDAVARIVDLEAEIDADTDEFVDYRNRIISMCEMLPDPQEKNVLLLKYVKYCNNRQTAAELYLCIRTVQYAHKDALDHLCELLTAD